MSSKEENKLIQALDEADLFRELQPAIQAALKFGGGSESILRRSQGLAAARLIELLNSPKEDVRLKAISQVLDRALGRSIERKVNVYADLEGLNEKELDRRLRQLMQKNGAADVLDGAIEAKATKLVKAAEAAEDDESAEDV